MSCRGFQTLQELVNLFFDERILLNTNTIPLTFSPSTEAHDAVINYYFPRAAGRIFDFLTRRAKPGTSQQFDKDDFDQHCIKVGRKPYSNKWFKICFDMLVSIRVVQVERKFRGYGFQVRAYHPWQVDDWIVDEFQSDRQKKKKKTSTDESKTSAKSTRNSDSAVALDRENRVKEKGNTKATNSSDRRLPRPILKKTAFAAPPSNDSFLNDENKRATGKEEITFTKIADLEETAATGKKKITFTKITDLEETAISTPLKGGDDINHRSTPLTSLKNDLKVILENVNQDNGDNKNNGDVDEKVNKEKSRTKPPKVDVKINNKEWRSHLEEVDQLGIKGNKTIVNALKTFSTERVKAAIALYRQRKIENGYIENPCGYFMQALQEDWAGKKAKEVIDNSQAPEDKAALFRYWFDLAKELGYCHLSEERDGERWVLISGRWERFIDAWERGYNLEYLRKVKKRTTDP